MATELSRFQLFQVKASIQFSPSSQVISSWSRNLVLTSGDEYTIQRKNLHKGNQLIEYTRGGNAAHTPGATNNQTKNCSGKRIASTGFVLAANAILKLSPTLTPNALGDCIDQPLTSFLGKFVAAPGNPLSAWCQASERLCVVAFPRAWSPIAASKRR